MDFIHRKDSGRLAYWSSLRYLLALVWPARDPRLVSGRALTPRERARA